MRVLYCTDTYLPQVNGVSVVTDLSARGLAARGWQVCVLAPSYPAARAAPRAGTLAQAPASDHGAVTVESVPAFPAPRYPELRIAVPFPWKVARVVSRFAPDIVHCATEFAIGRVGMWAAMRAGIPVVTTYHTNFGEYASCYGFGRLRGPLERYIASVHRAARLTYTPSSASRSKLWRMGVSDVEIWGRGVDTAQFSPSRRGDALRRRLALGHAFTFLHVGRLAPEKNVGMVLQAFRLLTQEFGPDVVRLIVAGAGPAEGALRADPPRGTVFLGNLDRDAELPELYASADAFVFASVTETLGLVVLEAMASGLPVIAVPAGGVRDHLRDGVNGIAVAPGDIAGMARAMRTLATVSGLRERLGAGARATAVALDWNK
jgi:glycosyltransferase involved in cell wall biosynthesis